MAILEAPYKAKQGVRSTVTRSRCKSGSKDACVVVVGFLINGYYVAPGCQLGKIAGCHWDQQQVKTAVGSQHTSCATRCRRRLICTSLLDTCAIESRGIW
jgi:hypothetical protein